MFCSGPHVHSASRGSVLLEASAGVTDSLLAGDGPSTPLLLAHVTSALALVISTQHTSPLTSFFKLKQFCNTGLPQHTGFHQINTALQHTSKLCSLLSVGTKEGRLEVRIFNSFKSGKRLTWRGSIWVAFRSIL